MMQNRLVKALADQKNTLSTIKNNQRLFNATILSQVCCSSEQSCHKTFFVTYKHDQGCGNCGVLCCNHSLNTKIVYATLTFVNSDVNF